MEDVENTVAQMEQTTKIVVPMEEAVQTVVQTEDVDNTVAQTELTTKIVVQMEEKVNLF